ncbi:FAD-binding oxidoreductase, partial [Acinetobacter baumannii]|nr:FAD-binding oxidoreductase [Acinetobacter baumannii]
AEMVGGGATAAGMGHIVVMDDSEAQFELTLYSQRLWEELAEELPPSVEYDRCGTIWVAATEDEMRPAERKGKFYAERGVAVELLDARELREGEPRLRRDLWGGLRVPGDGVIYPPAAAHFLLSKARAHRTELIVGRAVIEATLGGEVRRQDGSNIS